MCISETTNRDNIAFNLLAALSAGSGAIVYKFKLTGVHPMATIPSKNNRESRLSKVIIGELRTERVVGAADRLGRAKCELNNEPVG